MRRGLLETCLRAYPRELRERDGAELRDLAEELALEHGVVREALGLIRGGWRERTRRATTRRRTTIGVGVAGAAVLAVVTWSPMAVADSGTFEVEQLGCAGDCGSVEQQVAQLLDDGWTCRERRTAAAVAWRCTSG